MQLYDKFFIYRLEDVYFSLLFDKKNACSIHLVFIKPYILDFDGQFIKFSVSIPTSYKNTYIS